MKPFIAFLAGALLCAGASHPASAYDQLARATAIVPDNALSDFGGSMFEYAAPNALGPESLRLLPTLGSIGNALRAPDQTRAAIGIDLRALDSVLQYGLAGSTVAHLRASEGVLAPFVKVLPGRGFKQSTEGAWTLYSRGDEANLDLTGGKPDDPFDEGMGKSQRILVTPGGILVTQRIADMRKNLSAERKATDIFARMIAAARTTAGNGMRVQGLSAFTVAPFAQSDPPAAPDLQSMSAFALVFLLSATSPEREVAQIVLAYRDREGAEQGSTEIAQRLRSMKRRPEATVPAVETRIEQSGKFVTAVISCVFPGASPGAAMMELRTWQEAIRGHAFGVLAIFR